VRNRWLTTSAVLITAGALVLTGCSNSKGSKKSNAPSGSNSAAKSSGGGGLGGGGTTYKIGFEGPLSGANAQLGINEANAFKLAVAQANKTGNLGFTLIGVTQDDQGDPAQSPAAAKTLISDPTVIGVIGPSFSGSTQAVGPIYSAASPPMPFITPSATNAALGGWKTYHRIVPNDNVEGSQGADWLARKGIKKLYVLNDLSTYGKGVADTVAKEAKAKGIKVITDGVDGTTTKNYNPVAQTIANSGADALFYGGYDAQAALLAKALDAAGFKGLKAGGNGIKSTVFTKNAGASGNGWYFTCGCQDATVAPASKQFATDYQTMFKTPPSTYSPESYDATNTLIQAIKTAAGSGTATRQGVETALSTIDYKGITTEIKFQASGEIASSSQVVNLYIEKGGNIVEVGNIKDQS
jgi:branched-chain amino acid transport system substrate-binding protein